MDKSESLKRSIDAEEGEINDEDEVITKRVMINRSKEDIAFVEKNVEQGQNGPDAEVNEAPIEIKVKRDQGDKKKKRNKNKNRPVQSLLAGIGDLKALMYGVETKDINPELLAKDQSVLLGGAKKNNQKKQKTTQQQEKEIKETSTKPEEVAVEKQIETEDPAKVEDEEAKHAEAEEEDEEGEAEQGKNARSDLVLEVDSYPENILSICRYGTYCMFVKVTRHSIMMPDKFYKNQRVKKRKAGDRPENSDPNIKDYANDRKIMKYYDQRYFLFSKYDQGIVLDKESWYSVTPESVAKYLAKRLENAKTVVDGFCGAGGNAIQFAKKGMKVIANDFDSNKIEIVKKNAQVYEALDNIELHNEDFLALDVGDQTIDVAFLAPPWGGVNYCHENYSIFEMITPDVRKILEKAMTLSSNIILLLGRNTSIGELVQLFCEYFIEHNMIPASCSLEVEKLYISGRLKEITVYYGPCSKIDRGNEISYCYDLFGNNAEAKKILRPLFKEKGMRPFLQWYGQQEKEKDFDANDARNYKAYVQEHFPTPQVPTAEVPEVKE